ncbi:MAG: hypothetical protein QOC82_2794 [Frankiaceae bacterium]|jgi:hypothetical protein|nr:hypothetical protein [Frankiaceae bacterium]
MAVKYSFRLRAIHIFVATAMASIGIASPAHASSNPIETAISWAEHYLGTDYDAEKCQTFVHDAYIAAGIDIGGAPPPNFYAADYYKAHYLSVAHGTDASPPRGALVYWDATVQHGSIPTNPAGHVGISLGAGQAISTESYPDSYHVHTFSIAGRNAAGYPYLGWMAPPGVNVYNDGSVRMGSYLGHIVQWDGDTKTQRTAWLVVLVNGVVRRSWIPDISTYWCLKNRGAPGPDVLSSQELDAMPDQLNVWALCDPHQQVGVGIGGDGAGAVTEQAGHNGARTFSDYHNASGGGTSVAPAQYVQVLCKAFEPTVASVNPDGYWYQLGGDPWNGLYWAPANVFMNGDPWGGPYTHNTDFSVPDCGKSSTSGGSSSPTVIGLWREQQGHHGSATFSDYHSASGAGPSVAAGQYVNVSCKVLDTTIPSVNPDGYWYRLADAPWSGNYYAPANTFMNGDPWNGPYTHNTDFNVPDCAGPVAPPASPPAGSTFAEQQGHHGVNTFMSYHNASGLGPSIAAAQTVQVACKVQDGTIASVNPDGYWYLIASNPWSGNYYAPANTFMNGDPWNGPYSHNTDFNVPDCASAPPPAPSTSTETTGGATNTWTNYTNAGGKQGPTIPAYQSVQITCRAQGFTVADGNTWWYEIASSPWNNGYWASADAFYNNGATSGSLAGTPFYDGSVPVCGSGSSGPTTYSETSGGETHTWTNYTNAGGTEGQVIGGGTTIQVACKVQGFTVADGNPWWYRLASPPWSNQYYASADAFYNDGATSGSLIGTPYVDSGVPNC